MLLHPTLDKLQALGLSGMSRALQEQLQVPECDQLPFAERLGLLVDREVTEPANRRLQNGLWNEERRNLEISGRFRRAPKCGS